MFGEQGSIRVADVSMVHVDVLGWGDQENDRFEEIAREIEMYVVGACGMGLHRKEIELDLRERFEGTLEDLTFEIVTTRSGEIKGIVSADAFDCV